MNIQTTSQVGKTNLHLPHFGLGTAFLANTGTLISDHLVIETIQAALESGVCYFDTAPMYGRGSAERRLGRVLADVQRCQYIISTKVGILVQPDGSLVCDYSYDGMIRSFEQSLYRLKCDNVDILLIHDPDNHYDSALIGASRALDDLRSQGVVKAIGVGTSSWGLMADFAQNVDFDCFILPYRYTLLTQDALEFLNLCHEKRISILMAGVFSSGILATGSVPGAKYIYCEASPEILEKTREIEAICERFNVPLTAAAMQFPMGYHAAIALIVGCNSPELLQENLKMLSFEIPAAFWYSLRDADLIRKEAPIPV